jgi:hypothetical protein
MTFWLLRQVRNLLGAGYSGCGICGDRWNWKKEHTVNYAPHRGAFPVCEECWQNASDEEIISAAYELASEWVVQRPHSAETAKAADLMVQAVMKEARARRR